MLARDLILPGPFNSFSLKFPPEPSQPPRYLSWSSHVRGYPVPGLVSTLFHHMYSAPLLVVHTFLQETLQVWQPIHLSKWKLIESCALISITTSPPSGRCPSSPESGRRRPCPLVSWRLRQRGTRRCRCRCTPLPSRCP